VIKTWHVRSILPPECHETVSASSMLDAALAWATRVFHKGMLPRNGHEVIVWGTNDPQPRMSSARVRITIQNAPAFRATFAGLAYEGLNDDPKGGHRD
jgi:hypothetical protein